MFSIWDLLGSLQSQSIFKSQDTLVNSPQRLLTKVSQFGPLRYCCTLMLFPYLFWTNVCARKCLLLYEQSSSQIDKLAQYVEKFWQRCAKLKQIQINTRTRWRWWSRQSSLTTNDILTLRWKETAVVSGRGGGRSRKKQDTNAWKMIVRICLYTLPEV